MNCKNMNKLLKFLVTIYLALFSTHILFSQNEQTEDEEYASIPISKIPDYQIQATGKFYEVNRFLTDTVGFSEMKANLKELGVQVKQKANEFDSLNINNFNTDQLQRWDRAWLEMENRARFILNPVDKRLDNFDVFYSELNDLYHIWLETGILVKNADIPNTLKESVQKTKKDARELRGKVKDAESVYLLIKQDVNTILNVISSKRNAIDKAQDNLVKNLLVAEQMVLWKSYAVQKNDTLSSQKMHHLDEAKENARSFIKSSPGFIYAFVLLFVLVLIFMLYAQKYLKREHVIDQLQKGGSNFFILKRPALISLLLSWMVIASGFYLPVSIRSFILIIMLPPILFAFNGVFGKQKLLHLAVFGSYIFFKAIEFFLNKEVFAIRTLLLIISLLTAYVFWFIIYKSKLFDQFKKGAWFYRLVLNINLVLVVVSSVFLVLGNVYLGKMLLAGSIGIVVNGLFIYMAYMIFNSVFHIVLVMPYMLKSKIVQNHSNRLLNILKKLVGLALFYIWFSVSLGSFAIKNQVFNFLKEVFTYQFEIGTTSLGLNNLVAFVFAIYISIYVSRIILLVLNEEVFTRSNTDKGVSSTINMLIRYSIISLGFIFALAAAGIELEKISIIIGALGVGIGFGLQNIFNNLFSGIILALERPIKVDDIIQVGELTGVVKNIGFRSSTVRTYDGSDVIVPNGDIISNQMINWTHSDRKRRLKIDLGVSFDADPEEVIAVLKEVTDSHPMVEHDPAPRPRFLGYGDSTLEFQLLFWISDYDNSFGVGTEITIELHKKLKERGIEIPYPKRDITINKSETQTKS